MQKMENAPIPSHMTNITMGFICYLNLMTNVDRTIDRCQMVTHK